MLIAAIIIIILLTAADQLIKYWAIQELKPVGTMPFLHIGDKKILDLTYLENNGAVFSSFAGMRWLLVGTTVVLMAFCAYWLVRHGKIKADDGESDADSGRRSGKSDRQTVSWRIGRRLF